MASISRRRFLQQGTTTVSAYGLLAHSARALDQKSESKSEQKSRPDQATELRVQAAMLQGKRPAVQPRSNGDEDALPNRIGCYGKGLPHNAIGEIDPPAYTALLAAMSSGRIVDFEKLPRAGGRTLSNPMAAFTFHLEGGDPHSFEIPPAPSLTSPDIAQDGSELYWQALCRDIPFRDYASSELIARAARDLNTSPAQVFRGPTPGDREGPYLSQFLLKPVPFGATRLDQRYSVPAPGSDFMTEFAEWAQIQSGFSPWRDVVYDPAPRYLRTGRDLAEFAHYDFAYQAYLTAALILINSSARSIHNCNQFKSGNNPYRYSTVEDGFVTFGPAESADWIGRVTTAALKAAYYQKWAVHRRVRPEALGGLVHKTRTGMKIYPVHEALLHSQAVDAVFEKTNSYLLPQAYPEGCPLHPSYPSGHATIAGAGAVVLKACFDGSMLLPACVEPNADGTSLVPCQDYSPTINAEINKLAFNIAMARDWAGIHYRSDSIAGLQLGEAVGICFLQDMARTYQESFQGFTLQRFDGRRITITPDSRVLEHA